MVLLFADERLPVDDREELTDVGYAETATLFITLEKVGWTAKVELTAELLAVETRETAKVELV